MAIRHDEDTNHARLDYTIDRDSDLRHCGLVSLLVNATVTSTATRNLQPARNCGPLAAGDTVKTN